MMAPCAYMSSARQKHCTADWLALRDVFSDAFRVEFGRVTENEVRE